MQTPPLETVHTHYMHTDTHTHAHTHTYTHTHTRTDWTSESSDEVTPSW